MKHFKVITQLLIVVSLVLTTISACTTRNKLKTKTDDTFKEQVDERKTDDSRVSVDNSSTSSSKYNLDRKKVNDLLDIEYSPTYDANGNLVPFSYVKDEDGKKTTVNITGNAKVKSSSSKEEEKVSKEEINTLLYKLDSLTKVVKEVKATTSQNKTSNAKNVEVKPDYIKYIIWIGTGLVVLTAIIVVAFLYVKRKINAIKNLTGL